MDPISVIRGDYISERGKRETQPENVPLKAFH
jgi:hypothetical protein